MWALKIKQLTYSPRVPFLSHVGKRYWASYRFRSQPYPSQRIQHQALQPLLPLPQRPKQSQYGVEVLVSHLNVLVESCPQQNVLLLHIKQLKTLVLLVHPQAPQPSRFVRDSCQPPHPCRLGPTTTAMATTVDGSLPTIGTANVGLRGVKALMLDVLGGA